MAIYKTKALLLTLKPNQLNLLLEEVVKNALPIEFLNPADLGAEWNNLDFVKPDTADLKSDLVKIQNLLKYYPESGFWSAFDDTRVNYAIEDLNSILNDKIDLILIAQKILLLKENQALMVRLSKDKNKKLNNQAQIKLIEIEINRLKFEIDIDEDKIKNIIIPQFKKLHTAIELKINKAELPKYFFKSNKNSETYFGFVAFPESKEMHINKLLLELDINTKHIDWNKDLVIWEDEHIESFKQIPQSLGTVDVNEVDPTPIISFFFAFFFALAINDAIYGLIISVFTGYVLYFRKVKPELKNIFGLLFVSGLFSLVVGAITGSWAGNLFEKTPLNSMLSKFQLIKQIPGEGDKHLPIINEYLNNNLGGTSPVVALLAFAVFVGLVHIFTALILKAVNEYKAHHYQSFITEVAWISFLLSGIVYVGSGKSTFQPIILISMVVFLALVFVFNSGHGVVGKTIKGLVQLYDLVAFLADILSYTRLIAIGLTGAIIADVINLLAGLAYGENPTIISGFLFLFVLISGHIFNLIVGLFGAYINPLRLHYVEFLPKFYKGKARQFKTFDSNLTYGIVKNFS